MGGETAPVIRAIWHAVIVLISVPRTQWPIRSFEGPDRSVRHKAGQDTRTPAPAGVKRVLHRQLLFCVSTVSQES